MVKNYLFTMKSSNPKRLRKLLRELKERTKAESIEDCIVNLARQLYPDVVARYYPLRLELIVVQKEKKSQT